MEKMKEEGKEGDGGMLRSTYETMTPFLYGGVIRIYIPYLGE